MEEQREENVDDRADRARRTGGEEVLAKETLKDLEPLERGAAEVKGGTSGHIVCQER